MVRRVFPAAVLGVLIVFAPLLGVGRSMATAEDLIRRLSSDIYAEREEATRELSHRLDARAQLQAALQSPDPEVVRRVRIALSVIDKVREDQSYERVRSAAKQLQPDLMVDLMCSDLAAKEDPRCWDAVLALGTTLFSWESKQYGKADIRQLWWHGLRALDMININHAIACESFQPGRKELPRFLLVRADNAVTDGHVVGMAAVLSGSARFGKVRSSLMLVNGDMEIDGLYGSILVCDQNVTIASVVSSIVIARGAVKAAVTSSSTVVSGEDIEISKRMGTVAAVSAGAVRCPPKGQIKDSVIKDKLSAALRFVRFTEPWDLGIQVNSADCGVYVKDVKTDSCFDRAKLRGGDMIVGVAGVMVDTPDAFRRECRKRLANGQAFVLRVLRQQREVALTISVDNHSQLRK